MTDFSRDRLLHDLRQPLAAIMNFASAGSRMTEGDADRAALKSVFERIQEQAERLSELCLQQRQTDNLPAHDQQPDEGSN